MFQALRLRFFTVRQSLTWRVLTNAGWASAATPISVGLGIVQTGMLARMLGPEGIGAVALFGAISALFGSVFKITNAEAAMVYTSKAVTEGNHIQANHLIGFFYRIDFLSSLLAYGACAVSALFLPQLLNLVSGQAWLLVVFGLTLVFQSTYWTSHALLRLANCFSWTFFQAMGHSLIKTVMVMLLFVNGLGLREVVFLLVGLSLLDSVSLYLMARLALRRLGLGYSEQPQMWWCVPYEVWHFQLLGYGRQLIKSLNRYADTLLIGYIGSPLQVGFYRSGKQITDQVQVMAQGFVASLFPEYSRLYFAGEMDRLRRLVVRFTALCIGGGVLVSIIVWSGSEWIIRLVLGDAFLPAQDIVRVLMISAIVLMIMSPIYSLPAATGRAGPALQAVSVAIVVQISVILWLVPQYGALGAAWANMAYALTWALVLLPSIAKVLCGSGAQSLPMKSE